MVIRLISGIFILVAMGVYTTLVIGQQQTTQLLAYISDDGDLKLHLHDLRHGLSAAPRPLEMLRRGDLELKWSADDSQLYLLHAERLYTIDVLTGQHTKASLAQWNEFKSVAWSSYGYTAIASQDSGIHIVNAPGEASYTTMIPSGDHNIHHRSPLVWSPNGEHLIVTVANRLYLGSAEQEWRSRAMNIPLPIAITPTWSPNSTEIIFAARTAMGEPPDLYRLPVRSDALPAQLTDTRMTEMNPAWSPDGQALVYQVRRNQNNEIYFLSLIDGQSYNLSSNSANDFQPMWTDYGVIFISNRTGRLNLYLVNAETGSLESISGLQNADAFSPVVWYP